MRGRPLISIPEERPLLVALVLCGAVSLAYALTVPETPDLAAQLFRADLWGDHGFVLWSEAWYSGFTTPGYSLIYPPLGALIGPVALGIICALASTAIFGALAIRAFGDRAWIGVIWFGLASTVALWGSRTTFALGLTLALAALLALQRSRPWLAVPLALVSGLASPVSGLFCALAGAAVVLAARVPLSRDSVSRGAARLPAGVAVAVTVAAAVGTLAMGFAFPVDGYEPFRFAMWIWIPITCLVVLVVVPAEQAVIRWGALLYLLLALPLLVVETPLGDNAVRLGYTFAGPVLALALTPWRPVLLAVLAVPLLYWQWNATYHDIRDGLGNETAERAYFAPVLDAAETDAETDGAGPGRVHVPPTRTRWEARFVPERFPLARGWLRQLESDDFELFRDGELDPESYERWLREHGVSYVALPLGVELDYMGGDEAALLQGADGPLPFLAEIYSSPHWRLWRVRGTGGSPLVTGGARIESAGPDGYTVSVPGPGTYLLRYRYSPYLGVSADGRACISAAPGMEGTTTELVVAGPAPRLIEVEAGFSFAGLFRRSESCSQ
ncbi:MAG TPA: hypothetical protein VKA36_08770 [Solirubrobacterales bacterium]|nr:hypothetical protein [Solirubrobacterales bacterium]